MEYIVLFSLALNVVLVIKLRQTSRKYRKLLRQKEIDDYIAGQHYD